MGKSNNTRAEKFFSTDPEFDRRKGRKADAARLRHREAKNIRRAAKDAARELSRTG